VGRKEIETQNGEEGIMEIIVLGVERKHYYDKGVPAREGIEG